MNNILRRLRDLEQKDPGEPKCDNFQAFGQSSLCNIVKQQAKELGRVKERLDSLEKTLKALDRRLEAIEKFMPPQECL